ncbi:MAG TPA: hypothetical protein PLX54_03770 [Candidatus Fermentibacter daniensis]|nr:hypothetical protein [Candidatus Fermentibacter daniensis]HOR07549.1 hypothetical protein [Candidatus Fermentibacter daniensis]HPK51471.1 hypothetical protein [Candidatus Fermentibacter daniensis]
MSRKAVFRLVAFAVFIAVLRFAGLVSLDLPWGEPAFQIAGTTVLLYLAFSLTRPEREGSPATLSGFAPSAVLLVSAVDGLLLHLTPFPLPDAFRWIGPAAFAAGAVVRMVRRGRPSTAADALMFFGLSVGFDSIAGFVLAAPALFASGRRDDAGEEGGAE